MDDFGADHPEAVLSPAIRAALRTTGRRIFHRGFITKTN